MHRLISVLIILLALDKEFTISVDFRSDIAQCVITLLVLIHKLSFMFWHLEADIERRLKDSVIMPRTASSPNLI